ncbi:MAG TPA: DUF4190 domain-containing protein [Candidatus Avipropionibacterium avicola]|uniref:DUF4190 domain-containing protein n=1 Tax=Candidatus Avipropionibacterium avicola TaxID=2840701 RepID=A0A9D1H0V6_9ACTN|nr:DUF4190 domain-containing protein [Candidatus Avipropionibacterium avicola]
MTDSNTPDEWAPREWEPSDWQPSDEASTDPSGADSATEGFGSGHGDDAPTPGTTDDPAQGTDNWGESAQSAASAAESSDWSPWSAESSDDGLGQAGFDSGSLQVEGVGGSSSGSADDYAPADDYSPYADAPAESADDGYSPYSGMGGYETPPADAAPQPSAPDFSAPASPVSGPASSAPSAGAPSSGVSATPYGQQQPDPTPDPYAQPQQPSANPPAENFPAYQAPTSAPNPYAQPTPYGQPSGSPYGQQPGPYGQQNPYAQQGGYQPAVYGGPAVPVNHPRAVPSMVLGIVSLFCCPIAGVVALVLGIGSQREIAANPGRWTGQGMAIAGIVLGAIGTLIGGLAWISNLIN